MAEKIFGMDVVVIATLPDSGQPWMVTMLGGDMVCVNPDHAPIIITAGEIAEAMFRLANGRSGVRAE